MTSRLKEYIYESLSSVLPITLIVLIICTILIPLSIGTLALFLVGAALLIVGMGFFTLGADIAMTPMGESVGSKLTKVKKLWFVIIICFLMGFIITIAEPDLQVLANQVSAVPNNVLIWTIAVGVGLFLVIAVLRILFDLSFSKMLIIFYSFVFILSFFVPKDFIALAFDSGGVTTGPITVPFILAVGVGLSAQKRSKKAGENSFGLVALCSIGPILAVMILGILYNPDSVEYTQPVVPAVANMQDVVGHFLMELPVMARDVLIAMIPIVIFFIIFQLISRHFPRRVMLRMFVGIIYTYIGLVLFLTGVDVGFLPVGSMLGKEIAALDIKWVLIPIGMILGYFIVSAEPAVKVLNHQIEKITDGTIPSNAVNMSLSIGVGASIGLAMLRILTGISIYAFLIPGYLIALGLTFYTPKLFIGMAFDSGGVASGPMTSTFLLPFAIGVCETVGGNILTDAFGIVAMVAMTPLIAIQIMGCIYKIKMNVAEEVDEESIDDFSDLMEFDIVNGNEKIGKEISEFLPNNNYQKDTKEEESQ